VLGLRRLDGLDRVAFQAASGFALDDVVGGPMREWTSRGLATDDGKNVRLTRAGLLVSDALWGEIL
jgi:oxygen-independent coproporphyrinogen-3 oxidase